MDINNINTDMMEDVQEENAVNVCQGSDTTDTLLYVGRSVNGVQQAGQYGFNEEAERRCVPYINQQDETTIEEAVTHYAYDSHEEDNDDDDDDFMKSLNNTQLVVVLKSGHNTENDHLNNTGATHQEEEEVHVLNITEENVLNSSYMNDLFEEIEAATDSFEEPATTFLIFLKFGNIEKQINFGDWLKSLKFNDDANDEKMISLELYKENLAEDNLSVIIHYGRVHTKKEVEIFFRDCCSFNTVTVSNDENVCIVTPILHQSKLLKTRQQFKNCRKVIKGAYLSDMNSVVLETLEDGIKRRSWDFKSCLRYNYTAAMRHQSHLKTLLALNQSANADRKGVRVFVLTGTTGTGKSWFARNFLGKNTHIVCAEGSNYLEKYDDQKNILFEEVETFNRKGCLNGKQLLMLCEDGVCRLNVKFSSVTVTATNIFFVSNYNPEEWFGEDHITYQAFLRRIHWIGTATSLGKHPTWREGKAFSTIRTFQPDYMELPPKIESLTE